MIRVFEIANEVKDGWFEVEPNQMYPAIITHIRQCLANNAQGDGVIKGRYFAQAAALPAEGWDLAMMPLAEVNNEETRQLRAQALELARLWFTELLHRAIGGDGTPLRLRILKDDAWRL